MHVVLNIEKVIEPPARKGRDQSAPPPRRRHRAGIDDLEAGIFEHFAIGPGREPTQMGAVHWTALRQVPPPGDQIPDDPVVGDIRRGGEK